MRLTHQGGGGITDTITRHITEALGCDGKRVGSNGDIAQWCHDHGAHDLRTAHQDILYGYRDADLAGMVQVFLHPSERFLVLTQIEYPVTACREVEIGQRDADIGKRRAAGSSHYAHLHDVDKEVIEHHIADAYQHRHHTRGMHVACRLEHHLGDMIQEYEGQRQTVYQKITRGIARNISTATQPIRQMGMHSYTCQGNTKAEHQTAYQGMAEYLTSLHEIVGSDEMSHLHRETGSCRTEQTANEPVG